MTIYVAKILVEKPVGHSACKVKLASDLEEIKDYAEDAATAYANLYEGTIKIHSDKKLFSLDTRKLLRMFSCCYVFC